MHDEKGRLKAFQTAFFIIDTWGFLPIQKSKLTRRANAVRLFFGLVLIQPRPLLHQHSTTRTDTGTASCCKVIASPASEVSL